MNVQEPCFSVDLSQQPLTETKQIDFFITGLPRCRLAWIANYLTYGNMECHFDAFKEGLDHEGPDAVQKFAKPGKVVGIADCAAVLFQNRMMELNPNAKWVVIDRPHDEIITSIKNLGVPIDGRLTKLNYKLGELKLKTPCLIIPFHELDMQISNIAAFVNPGWFCPHSRHDMMVGLNIQSKATKHDLEKIPVVNSLSVAAERPTPTKTQEMYFATLQEICGDNKLAYKWLWQAIEVASILDHVTDGDIMDLQHFDYVMKGVLLEWGINPFYRQNAICLVPVMAAAISAWQHSTGSMQRVKHYDIYSELPISVAYILGGQDAVDKFSPKVRGLVEQLMLEDNQRDANH